MNPLSARLAPLRPLLAAALLLRSPPSAARSAGRRPSGRAPCSRPMTSRGRRSRSASRASSRRPEGPGWRRLPLPAQRPRRGGRMAARTASPTARAGRWRSRSRARGTRRATTSASDEITFACTNGALAKCVRWGYKPWKTVNGVSLADYHQACVHMTPADYCGDGKAHTRDGTLIDIWDRLGVQKREPSLGLRLRGRLVAARRRVPPEAALRRDAGVPRRRVPRPPPRPHRPRRPRPRPAGHHGALAGGADLHRVARAVRAALSSKASRSPAGRTRSWPSSAA